MSGARRAGLPFVLIVVIVTGFAWIRSEITPVPAVAIALVAAIDSVLSWTSVRFAQVSVRPEKVVLAASTSARLDVTLRPVPGRLSVALAGEADHQLVRRDRAVLTLPPSRVGVALDVEIDVECTSIGLVTRRRRVRVELDEPLYRVPTVRDASHVHSGRPSGDLSSVREYRSGDRPSRINWAASARTGALMVRAPGDLDGLTLVVDVGPARPPDDRWLDRAASIAAAHLGDGDPIRLITRKAPAGHADRGRVVDQDEHALDDVLRRLASLAPGPALPGIDDALVITPPSTEAPR